MGKTNIFKKTALFMGILLTLSCNTFANEVEIINPTAEEIALSQIHEQNKLKTQNKRNSSQQVSLGTPSISLPAGIGFSIDKVSTTYTPDELLYSATATRK